MARTSITRRKELLAVKGLVIVGVCALFPAMDLWAECPRQNAARVDEIAAWLDEQPGLDTVPVTNRSVWDKLAEQPGVKKFLKDAEKVRTSSLTRPSDEHYLDFTRNGNRTRFQKENDALNSELSTLVFAEAYENKGRYLEAIAKCLDIQCDMRSWTLPAHDGRLLSFNGRPHVDLGAGMKAALLSQVMVLLGERLPVRTRARVLGELDRRIFKPYLETARNGKSAGVGRDHWWFDAEMNWNSVCNDTCVRSALLVVPDRRTRAEFVEAAERTAPCALRGYGEDGYCFEGMGYWNYGYGHYLYLGLAVCAATHGKVDLFADPKTKRVMEYAYGYQLQNDRSPNFADGGGTPAGDLLALGRQIWPDLVNTMALKSPIRSLYSWTNAADVFPLRGFGQEPAPTRPTMDELPKRTWFPSAQVLIARDEGQSKSPLSIAIKGGTNDELHNHNDIGSYSVMFDGFEYAGDPGGEIYTRRTFSGKRYESKVLNSYGHPVPRVGGQLQPTGRQSAAKVLKTDFSDACDVLVLDLTACYQVSNLVSLVRTMTFDRARRSVTVSDQVSFSAPTTFESPIVTYSDVIFDYDKARLQLSRDKNHALGVLVETTGGEWSWATELLENPGKCSAKRLAVCFAKPITTGVVTFTYEIARGGSARK